MKKCKVCKSLLFNVINFSVNDLNSIVSPFYKDTLTSLDKSLYLYSARKIN